MKYEVSNDYDKWGPKEGHIMHMLLCDVREWFIWSNAVWGMVATYLLAHSVLLAILAFFVIGKLAFDIAGRKKPKFI